MATRTTVTRRHVHRLAAALVCAVSIAGCVRAGPALIEPAPPASQPATSEFLQRSGMGFQLAGQSYRVVGVNAYELATSWGANFGCGGMLDDAALDEFFARLPAHAIVRIWGFQSTMATNASSHARDWSGLDRVVAAAQRHDDQLIISLGNQSGSCDDGHWKDRAWYSQGYRSLYPGDGYGIATASYWDWMHEIVNHYRSSPAVAMWEPINEPEASECADGFSMHGCYGHQLCPDEADAAAALRRFFDVVGAEIKRVDPNHLVESGALGGNQCGWVGDDYAKIHASPGVDVASYHDYAVLPALPVDLSARLVQTRLLNKPLIVGELGMESAANIPGCSSFAARAAQLHLKVTAMLGAGVAGVFLWNWVPNPQSTCTYDIGTGDAVLTELHSSM